jgi:hypothetical protein
MTIEVSLTGLISAGVNEDRALALLDVTYNGEVYKWQTYVPANVDLATFLTTSAPRIEAEIVEKEAAWAALSPKIRVIQNPITQTDIEVPIAKDEIVKPDIPDYYALRREKYPPIAEQLDAIWKGYGSDEVKTILSKIEAVKAAHPKKALTVQERQKELTDSIVRAVQFRLDAFARTRGYDTILSACTYENSSVPKFSTEAKYCIKVRGDTWAVLYQILDDVLSAKRSAPSSYADIESELPTLAWPL